jgi:hypothetical protein
MTCFCFLQARNGNSRHSTAEKAAFLSVFTYHFGLQTNEYMRKQLIYQ